MKKTLSILLALVMVLSLGTVAFAAEDDTPANSKVLTAVADDPETTEIDNAVSFDVETVANVIPDGAYANIKYAVKVEWTVDAAKLDINKGDVYKWNPTTYKYEKDTVASNSKIGTGKSVDVEIKLTNSSNAAVTYTIEYADLTGDVYTTAAGAKVEGKLESADTIEGVAIAPTASYDYDIDFSKQGDQIGEVQTAEYKDTVTVTAISKIDDITDDTSVKLGTYTVTLGKYVAPEPVVETKPVADILATVEGGFPKSTNGNQPPADAWVENSDASNKIHLQVYGTELIWNHGDFVQLSDLGSATKNEAGNYVIAIIKSSIGEDEEVINLTTTWTFTMDDSGVLQSIQYDFSRTVDGVLDTENEEHFNYSAPTTT